MKQINAVSDFPVSTFARAADLARLAGGLAHSVRVALLDLLKEHPYSCSSQLGQLLGMSHTIVAQHLKVMKEAGLVEGAVIGKRIAFFVKRENLLLFESIVTNFNKEPSTPSNSH